MIIKVALSIPPNYSLDYITDNNNVQLFDRVIVYVGKRKLIGFIIKKNIEVNYKIEKIRPIVKFIDNPINIDMQKLIIWMSRYYCSNLYNVISLVLPTEFFKKEIVRPQQDTYIYVDYKNLKNNNINDKQKKLINNFNKNEFIRYDNIKNLSSTYIINKLFEKSILKKSYKLKKYINKYIKIKYDPYKELSKEQNIILKKILSITGFHVFLLYGVTGSGKTEIYLHTINKYLKNTKQVLIMVPEINLIPQTIKKFRSRFPKKNIVTLHSKLSEKIKITNWLKIKKGDIDIVISTRSGVFSDFKNLGIIIVDEEHDSSFKQQNRTIRYNARDIAIFRAKLLGIPVILGSATPSIQSYYNSLTDKYTILQLDHTVLNNYKTSIQIIDLKSSIVNNGISNKLLNLLKKNIISYQQSVVFINKLGFAKALVCNQCNKKVECNKCDKPYTLHNIPYQYLKCHFCGFNKTLVTVCTNCGSQDLFTYGTGIEKVQSSLEDKFPHNKIVRFDRSNIKSINDILNINKMIKNNIVDILVGTQMIAKSHQFENITLIGLINIDVGLYSTDFYAVEKTAQMIVQVSGQSGRINNPGMVLLQTYQPENKLLDLLINNDYLKFLDYLLYQRKYANYPPYTYQAKIIAEHIKEKEILSLLNHIYLKFKNHRNVKISKPLPAMHLKKNNIYRYSLLLTSKKRAEINLLINSVNKNIRYNLKDKIKIYFDVDPIEL